MKKSEKIKVGISIGDFNGIGIEVILKTFEDMRMLDFCTPIIFGSSKIISYHKKALQFDINIHGVDHMKKVVHNKLNLYNISREMIDVELGKETVESGRFAFESLKHATEALKNKEIDVLITAPINKHNIQSENFNFKGHTEYLESVLEGESLMILMTKNLRIGLITGHIPISEVAQNITAELIKNKVDIMYRSLQQDFNISKPKIAILGLNPHCGDQGVIGEEDDTIVKPTLEEIQNNGKLVYGPYSADSFFGSNAYTNFDGVLAMYHDQGLAPFKTLSFGEGVNFTAGLNRVRTSPDHGTAFDIAGKGKANCNSFKQALFEALSIFKNRREFNLLKENSLAIKER